MVIRHVLLAVMLLLACVPARADDPEPTVQTTTADSGGEAAQGCLVFAKDVDPSVPAADFMTIAPAARPGIEVTGNKICLSGLAYSTSYTVTLNPGLRFADGTTKRAVEDVALHTPIRDSMVGVAGRGWILPRQTSTGVTIQTINVPVVRVRVLRLSERELVSPSGEHPDPAKQSFSVGELQDLTANSTTEIWSGTMQTTSGRNITVETAFPLTNIIDRSKPGAYIVLAENAAEPPAKLTRDDNERYDWNEYQRQIAGHWVLSTDLGVSSLQGRDGLRVIVRSLADAAPLAGVKLQLLSRAQDTLAEATTGPDGSTVFAPGLLRGQRGAAATKVLATTTAGDMTVQDLVAPPFDLSDRGADGRAVPGPIEAYLYTDRGIYRPGETVQVMALLRSHGLSAVDGAGLTLLLRRPDGVEASRTTLPPQPDAGFHDAIDLGASSAQGNWTIEALVDPSLPPVGRTTISVQDFVPQQLKVALSGPSAPLAAGENLKAAIDGRFLYGAPADGLHAEGDIHLVRDEHPVPEARDYTFGIAGETIPDAVQTLTLDDADPTGHVTIDTALEIPDGLASPLRAELSAGLTEPGGRTVRETLSIPVRTHPVLIGLRKLFGERVNTNDNAAFAIRTFDAEGKPSALNGLTWRLVREDQRWDWWRAGQTSGWSYHYYTVDTDIDKGTLDVPADRPADLSRKPSWGTYRLIVSDTASGAASSVRFSVGWGSTDQAADVPDRLEVTTDRPVLSLGQTAQVHVRGPFSGPAELVVESAGNVLETRRIDLPAEGTTIAFQSSAAWGQGVHILATAYRPLTAPGKPHDPVRAVGLAWISADPAPHTLGVSIGGAHQVTPRQTVRIPIHVTGAHGPAFVTLSAVDEGILQLTRFVTPDPVAALLARTRLELDMRDDYGRLLEGHANAGALHEGGDEGGSLGGVGLPVTTTRVVALFHGPVALDGNGDASVALDLPDFAGELRLMAVAYDHEAAGHAEAALTLRDPVVADVSLPRFLAPGDVADIGVSLNDTDGPSGDYHVALTATGAISLSQTALDTHLDAGQRRDAHLSLTGRGVGIGHIKAVLTGPNRLSIQHDWDIAVRSPHPDLVVSQTEAQAPGETYTPKSSLLAPFVPGSVHVTIGYSAIGGLDVPGLLQSLYTYPYGCTEQLSSSAFPLLYFNDARLLGKPANDPGVQARVQGAIETIAARQDAEGQFGLWRVGDGQASVWLNVYALDFLLHAREAGFTVPERVTTTSASWIDGQVRSGMDIERGAYSEPIQPTRAYADYVLARTGRVDPGRLRALSADLKYSLKAKGSGSLVAWGTAGLASPLSLAHLAGAQSLMGQTDAATETFRLANANIDVSDIPKWWFSAFYWSPLRDIAGTLAIAAETGRTEVAAPLLQRIANEHLNPRLMNTQEKAWLLAAAHALQKQGGSRALSIDGAAPQTVSLPFAVSPSAEDIAKGTSVRNADAKPVFRTVTLRGAPATAPPALAEGFEISRETVTLNGGPLDDTNLRQTDRFIVVLTGSADHGDFRRAVVADLLPAGLEIEAPILREDSYPFLGQLTKLRAHEERDDRFVAAFDIGSEDRFNMVDNTKPKSLDVDQFRVAYIVRAVTPGHFVRPETVVEDMYRPQVMARTTAGQITIAPR